jgi:hypothetical protein
MAMSSVDIQPVLTRHQRKLFLEFPWSLYRDDPLWIPPLRGEQKQLAGFGRHPFYERNISQAFLAYRGGELCGRIAAIHNHTYVEVHDEPRGFFGFFECTDDEQVAHAMFDTARQWLAERGLTCLRGPASPGLNYTIGTLIEGFDSSPTFLMPYNPAYYPQLIESYGFQKSQDLYAFRGNVHMFPAVAEKYGPTAAQIQQRFDVKLRRLNRFSLYKDVAEFIRIYNQSLSGTWGYEPMSDAEVRHMAKGLKYMLIPELTAAAEVDGKLVGAAFSMMDYNPRIKEIDGRLFPFGFLRLFADRKRIKKARVLAANVLPAYHLMGIGLVLLSAMVPDNWEQWDTEEVEYSWVSESNQRSWGALEKGGAERYKTYRVYDWNP